MNGAHTQASNSSPTFPRKRLQSKSPSPPSKRRAPPSYVPPLYAPVPSSASALPNFHRSLSVEASYGGTPVSERSSPGLDWLQRTEDLHLVTPVGLIREGEGDTMMETEPNPPQLPSGTMRPQEIDEEEDSHTLAYSPLPAMPLSRSGTSSPFNRLVPAPPHDAPPLHQHLAGSPSMTRSSSPASITSHHEGSSGGPPAFIGHGPSGQILQQAFPPTHTMSYDDSELSHQHHNHHGQPTGDNDVSMGSAGHVSNQSQTQGATRGGWKITMGFRPDCDKCQQRIPGHYSHVVYSS